VSDVGIYRLCGSTASAIKDMARRRGTCRISSAIVHDVRERSDGVLSVSTRKRNERNDGFRPTLGLALWPFLKLALLNPPLPAIASYLPVIGNPKMASQRSRGMLEFELLATIVHYVTTLCGAIPNMFMRLCLSRPRRTRQEKSR